MTDPAEAAADRAFEAHEGPWWNHDSAEAAACEALKPLRRLHEPEPVAQGPDHCVECEHKWPCESAKLIYPESELTND